MKSLFTLVFVLVTTIAFAQTPGEIYDDAANSTTNPMDPDGDGFVGVSGAYTAAMEDNELTFSAIPQVTEPEPDGDIRTGSACGASDVVDNSTLGGDASYVYFDDVAQIMVYRIRLAQDAAGAFGYSVLVDTDGAFGFTGSSPDNNAVTGNPGFEFEIRYVTGASNLLYVDDVDGSADSNSTLFTYDLDDNTQRVYARFQDTDCVPGVPVFYDFFIPLSSMSLTESSVIRLAAATSSNPSNSILSNPSDIAGIDDDTWTDTDLAYIELLGLQGEGTPVGNLGSGGCFLSGTSDTPTLFNPIFDSNSRVNGSSTEPEGAFITAFTNGDTLGTTTTVDANGFWTVSFSQGDLRPFDEITVVARDSCEYESPASTKINAINDLDSDDDGILDSQEGNGVDPGGDDDGDDIPNYLDTDYAGFVDTNMDGINDNFDPDLDGIPNHFDPDANGDGLPDIYGAGGGSYDTSPVDGIIDEMLDSDGDGIPDIVDVDATGGTDADFDGIDDAYDVTYTAGTDADGDGIDDATDPDDDNDGLYEGIDTDEGGTPLTVTDADGDGILDYLDLDADGDGIPNTVEGSGDQDGDGIPNHQDIDADGDGILDNIEAFTAAGYVAPTGVDTDGDGLDDAYDADCAPCGSVTGVAVVPVNTDGAGNADYLDVDSDGDGIGDFTESNDNNMNGISDAVDVLITGGTDSDSDGIDDAYDASVAACTDTYNANDGTATADGICDSIQNGGATDTDGDGLADIYDADNGGTLPGLPDTDGDGTPNYQDEDDDGDGDLTSAEGTGFTQGGGTVPDYLFNPDADNDGILDVNDSDSDNDGLLDADEDGGTGFNPLGSEDGGDGIPNYLDLDDPNFDNTDSNSDGIVDIFDFDLDGVPDFKDLDADGDGITDIIEAGGTDANGDGRVDDVDYYADTDGDGIIDEFDVDQTGGSDAFDGDGIDDAFDVDATGGTDADGDGIDDLLDGDADDDGILDSVDATPLTPPNTDGTGNEDFLDTDSDDDGITDNVESQSSSSYVASSGNDSDNDGIDDSYDPDNGGTAISPVNTDGTGDPDYQDTDADDDGVDDIIEGNDGNIDGIADASYSGVDTDGDGLDDNFDPDNGGTSALTLDTDGDGTADFQDTDDDADGMVTDNIAPFVERNGVYTQGGGTIPDYLYNPDTDGDGVDDDVDVDSDNDGIPDADEDAGTGFDPTADEDGDGTLNYLDDNDNAPGFPTWVDVNNDGINDLYDIDLDGIANFRDADSDNDGVYDIVEAGGTDADNNGILDGVFSDGDSDGYSDIVDSDNSGTALTNADSDGDGVTDAYDVDSDNDGLPDVVEYGGNDANGDGRADDNTDSDRDGIADIFDTDSGNGPLSPVDTDGDGLVDNASDRDSDGDGISDLVEAGGIDADNDGLLDDLTDTDGDGLPDLVDTDNGGTALTVPDTDGDGIRDYLDLDSDGDGILDNVEAQPDVGYVAPNGVSDGNGFDTAYSGAGLIPQDTDNDGTPDYQDTDSDHDHVNDQIEGNDANGDGIADSSPSGTDTDGDGLDDTYDTDNSGTALSPQDFNSDGENDYRDVDDDGDGIATVDEPLDLNPVNGTPNYLEDSTGSCGLGFLTTSFSGSADGVFSESGTVNFTEADGTSDNTGASLDLNDWIILDLTDEIPQGNSVIVHYASEKNNDAVTLTITSSLTSGGTYGDSQSLTNPDNTYLTQAYTVNTSGGIRYLRIEVTAQDHANADANLDAVTYAFTQCDQDTDNDGIADVNDSDDDNDGIPDTEEGGGTDPSADADGDGVFNYEDADFAGFVDTDGDGINDNFDFDLDGIPNHMDLDSDSDGITDAVEANDGTLPANMNDQGRYTISYVQANDFDGDGHANAVDTDDGGTALPTPDTDLDGSDDYLDRDSDNDGNDDYIEAFDDDEDGDALDDLLARADAFEAAAGNPGYYLSNDDNNGVDDGDGIPDWLEDGDSDGIPNYLDQDNAAYQDTDGDGLIDLFDSSDSGVAYASPGPDNDNNGVPDFLQMGEVVTLPVTYLFIKATGQNGQVVIEWATATELNNSHFTVERSENGVDFYAIGRKEGAGDSDRRIDYSFIDSRPLQDLAYYRLVQEDYDGTQDVSDIYVASLTVLNGNGLVIYPNPASSQVTIETLGVRAKHITIVDLTGRDVYRTETILGQPIQLPELKSGLYMIKAQTVDGKSISGRLLIQN